MKISNRKAFQLRAFGGSYSGGSSVARDPRTRRRGVRELSRSFDRLYAREGRPSIPPERLLRALLLQASYTVRSERQLMEQHKAEPPAPASLVQVLKYQGQGGSLGVSSETAKERSGVRDNIYKLIAQLKHVEEAKGASSDDKKQANSLSKQLGAPV